MHCSNGGLYVQFEPFFSRWSAALSMSNLVSNLSIWIQPFVVVVAQKMGFCETPFGTLHAPKLAEHVR